jgi:uncharacterized membrane protein YphA (DoxX/SURF4 family)
MSCDGENIDSYPPPPTKSHFCARVEKGTRLFLHSSPLALWERVRVRATSGYNILRIFLAAVLLTAAVLKTYELATGPVVGDGFLDSRWLLIVAVAFEISFGIWLLAGFSPRQTWAAALLCFVVFACVSLYKALSGHASCGCFGPVQVNPWYTTVFDATVVLLLLYFRPSAHVGSRAANIALEFALMVLVIGLVIVGCGAVRFGSFRSSIAWLQGCAISVDNPAQTFNNVDPGKELHVKFNARNIYGSPVKILGVKTSCGLINADNLPMELAPGQAKDLNFTVYLRRLGNHKSFVYLAMPYLDVASAPTVMSVSGTTDASQRSEQDEKK